METFDAIRTVLAVRSFTDRPLPDDVIARIVEAGRLTASAANRQPWSFVVVQDRETLRRLGGTLARNGPYVAEAAVAVAVVIERTPYAVSDASRAIQSMLLAAWSEEWGGNWVGFTGSNEAFKPILGIPDDLDVPAILPFGYPADPGGKGRKDRKPLTEVAFLDRWGQPFTPAGG